MDQKSPQEEFEALRKATDPSNTAHSIALKLGEEAFGPAFQFCKIPARYQHCLLGHRWVTREQFERMAQNDLSELMQSREIINPRPPQLQALIFFRALYSGHEVVCKGKKVFDPQAGVYLIGPPGCGKTHILAAAAQKCHEMLWKQLEHYVGEAATAIARELRRHADAGTEVDLNKIEILDSKSTLTPQQQQLKKLIERLREKLASAPHRPTDVLYIGFDDLYDLTVRQPESKDQLFKQIVEAQLLFLDDPHPKGVEARFQLIQDILEQRYNCGKRGTFITSNLEPTEMSNKQAVQNAGDLASRLRSRCKESFWTISFENCIDWRDKVRSRSWQGIKELISGEAERVIREERLSQGLPAEPGDDGF